MKHALKISLPPCMTDDPARAVMAALNEGGGKALFVGGCVREAVLGRAAQDVDIATTLTPDNVIKKLNAAGITTEPTGIAHGTVTAITAEGKSCEVTTLRRDVSTDGRRATVAFTEDWLEDARRRDFTINTLLADERGHVYDPLGTGIDDLKAGRVVFVGDPAVRIAEDRLRILRFFRFYAWFGKGKPDPAALAACRAAAGTIAKLSKERVTAEIFKLLSAQRPGAALSEMRGAGVLKDFFAPEFDSDLFNKYCALQDKFQRKDETTRLCALSFFDRTRLDKVQDALALSNENKKAIAGMIDAAEVKDDELKKDIKKLVYKNKNRFYIAILLWRMAAAGEPPEFLAALDQALNFTPPDFPLSGSDLIKAGMKPGPQIGKILSEIERWWVEQDYPPRESCLQKLEEALLSGS